MDWIAVASLIIAILGIGATIFVAVLVYRRTDKRLIEIGKDVKSLQVGKDDNITMTIPGRELAEKMPSKQGILAYKDVGTRFELAENVPSGQTKEAAQKRLDEDTERAGYVRGEIYQLQNGSWGINWKVNIAMQPPCAFHGTVQVNGQNVPDGTVITAIIGTDTYTTTTTHSTYMIVIVQPQGRNYVGLTVSFMIGNAIAIQTGTWAQGGNVWLNLTSGGQKTTLGP